MNDNEIRRAVYDIIIGDDKIVEMLGENSHVSQPENNVKSKFYSVMTADQFDYNKHEMPVVTIQMGSPVRTDYHLVENILYIRCYNNSQKSFVNITEILSRIVKRLHRAELPLDDNRLVECVWTSTSAESIDEAYNLPYREATFTIATV
jgi:hypothetical protein|uniref:Tail completion protein n=1 Tax=Myoviridae sp. ctp4Q36 TaxID=2827708 RepID=A0A8S5T215_9CAUD|nr:MAG TPA: Protein of unknown function (DUF3168) [Myoviridae sp. ctp4Q36]